MPQGKKIILTTDQDLLKDGVQPIDDEFLEWFVKNPNCESVEVGYGWIRLTETDNEGYWISIPDNQFEMQQEEPKQELERGITITYVGKPKQETLEEAAKRLAEGEGYDTILGVGHIWIEGFEKGAKWQQERSYSEEDLREAFRQGKENMDYSDTYGWTSKLTEQEWFEQFKKK